MSLILDGTNGLSDVDGTAAAPALRGTDANTGIFFPAADTIAFAEGGAEIARFDSSGNLGIGTAGAPLSRLDVAVEATLARRLLVNYDDSVITVKGANNSSNPETLRITGDNIRFNTGTSGSGTERARIDSSGSLLVGKTASSFGTAGVEINAGGGNFCRFTRDGGALADFNRLSNDGELIGFWQATTQEGSISVSGTTVSYNGGHLSRYAQTTSAKDESIVKGTVLSNLDAMNVYTKDGQPVDNEQLNKVKVSDVEGDANVAGVFVNWTHDDAHDVDEINMAMTGDMIIRIAQGVTVARGDLLMSAGDGTAKPQGDDIVRSKTVAKVTSTHVTCTYADGSFCVPCVLMAC